MLWVSIKGLVEFEKLVKQIVTFHEYFGKDRNQGAFQNIAVILQTYLECISATNLPAEKPLNENVITLEEQKELLEKDPLKAAGKVLYDQADRVENMPPENRIKKNIEVIDTLTTQINLQLKEVINEKFGNANNVKFTRDLMDIVMSLVQVNFKLTNSIIKQVEELNAAKIKVDQSGRKSSSEDIILETTSLLDHEKLPINVLKKELVTEEQMKEFLGRLEPMIISLNTLPPVSTNCNSMFNQASSHAAKYYPKAMLTSFGATLVGVGYELLNVLSDQLGNLLDERIHADETHFNHQYLFSAVLVVFGATCGAVALWKSWPKRPAPEVTEVVTPENEQRREQYMRIN